MEGDYSQYRFPGRANAMGSMILTGHKSQQMGSVPVFSHSFALQPSGWFLSGKRTVTMATRSRPKHAERVMPRLCGRFRAGARERSIFEHSMNSIGRTQGLAQKNIMFHMLKIEYEISANDFKLS